MDDAHVDDRAARDGRGGRAGRAGGLRPRVGSWARSWLESWLEPWLGPWSPRRLWTTWAVSRVVLVVLAIVGREIGAQHSVLGDVRLYAQWAAGMVHGHGLPNADVRWQYPPGAAFVLAGPGVLARAVGGAEIGYEIGFFIEILAVDLAVTAALARRSGRAARFWTVGIIALGPVALARFDVAPAALAVAALLALQPVPGREPAGRARWGWFGFAAGLGTAVKVWPVLLLVVARPPGRRELARLAGGLLAAGAVLVAALAAMGALGGAATFTGAQRARGLQLEAVAALPFVVAHVVGAGPGAAYGQGSEQFSSAAARTVASACSVAEAVVIVAVALWCWWPRRGGGAGELAGLADRALALLLVVMLTSRVLSPQYLVWALAVAAVRPALLEPAGPGGRPGVGRRDAAVTRLLLGACLLSLVIYPVRYQDLIDGRVTATLLLVARDLVLLALAVLAVLAVRAAPAGRPGGPGEPGGRPPRPGRRPRRRRAGDDGPATATSGSATTARSGPAPPR